jgi:hypothetical protein
MYVAWHAHIQLFTEVYLYISDYVYVSCMYLAYQRITKLKYLIYKNFGVQFTSERTKHLIFLQYQGDGRTLLILT